ncbi:MAG: hypothetical protein ACHQRM_10415 [Bacteroidia bacterium]
MKTKEVNVPSGAMYEVALFIAENEVPNEILGTTENDEVTIAVRYEKDFRETISEMEELIADWKEENEEE